MRYRHRSLPLTPYTGPFGTPELRHLLRRSLFGATVADMAHFNGQSLAQVVDELLAYTNNTTPPIKAYSNLDGLGNPDPTLIDPDVPFGTTWINTVRIPGQPPNPTGPRTKSYQDWWTGLLLEQERNLREKLTLFWYNSMPIQSGAILNAELCYTYNQMLRNGSTGNFRQLLYDLTVNGAMLLYLNGYLNIGAAPDENYARELMELFTLGEGSGYTQGDVAEAARLLTGWSVVEESGGNPILPIVVFNETQHDATDKQFGAFFNNTVIQGQAGPGGGALEIGALLDMIVANEECSLFVCRQLFRWFVHTEIDAAAETDVIVPLAQIFRDNAAAPDQMRIVMQALLTCDHFFSAEVRGCMVKSPVDLVVGTIRNLRMPLPDASLFEAQYNVWGDIRGYMADAGQEVGEAPNVAGWPAYYQQPAFDALWMDSAQYSARKHTWERLCYLGILTPMVTVLPQNANLEYRVDFIAVVQEFSDPGDPNVLVAEAADLLFGVSISQTVKDQLKVEHLLLGQLSDLYWTVAYATYIADPNTQDPAAQMVPTMLTTLFLAMQGAAEAQLM
ncbi:MAG: DUF1800 family protein [Flavobacteriales bacterium]